MNSLFQRVFKATQLGTNIVLESHIDARWYLYVHNLSRGIVPHHSVKTIFTSLNNVAN